jgi:hypothetical protein
MFVVHDTLLNQRKMKKNIIPTYKIFFLSHGNGFSPELRVYYAFITHEV